MAQKTGGYRPTPTSPAADVPRSTQRPASDDTDAVLDDIDECLESNALEVLRTYVQAGGQ